MRCLFLLTLLSVTALGAIMPSRVVADYSVDSRLKGKDPKKSMLRLENYVANAKKGDVVLVCGKGHETTQEIAGVKHRFDDREVVRAFSMRPRPVNAGVMPGKDR